MPCMAIVPPASLGLQSEVDDFQDKAKYLLVVPDGRSFEGEGDRLLAALGRSLSDVSEVYSMIYQPQPLGKPWRYEPVSPLSGIPPVTSSHP